MMFMMFMRPVKQTIYTYGPKYHSFLMFFVCLPEGTWRGRRRVLKFPGFACLPAPWRDRNVKHQGVKHQGDPKKNGPRLVVWNMGIPSGYVKIAIEHGHLY